LLYYKKGTIIENDKIPQMLKKIVITFSVVFIAVFGYYYFCPGITSAAFNKADKVVVIKGKRVLLLMRQGEIFKTYKVALGQEPNGHKTKAGDKKTPEGTYILDSRNPDSKFHLAIHISYPKESDILNAHRQGVSPGGDIMIHGLPQDFGRMGKLHRLSDWTNGCIAVTNNEIEEIWRLVPDGTPIEIKP
jgi:murein L,D-transpeptidase YafK